MLLSLLLTAAANVMPAPLASSGPWNVEEDDRLCLLSRPFGQGDDQVLIGFQPLFTNPDMEMIVITNDRTQRGRLGKATVERMPDGRVFDASYVSIGLKDGKHRFTRLRLSADLFRELPQASSLRVVAGETDVAIQIKVAEKALPIFAQCEDKLLTSWGIDPVAIHNPNGSRPEGNPARYFGFNSYPWQALREHQQGRVLSVLSINASGAVTACKIMESAGKELDQGTCAVAQKIRFHPALDVAGKPVPSIYVMPVRWELPNG